MAEDVPRRRCSLRHLGGAIGIIIACLSFAFVSDAGAQDAAPPRPLLAAPISVYNNWSAYDELSDDVPLTESLAMRELGEMLRLKKLGVHFDYYMMDAFWYEPEGGYRSWRKTSWPNGPDRWLAALKANGIKPGLWFSTNTLTHMKAVPAWRASLDQSGTAMSLSTGGFLADFMDVLQYWHDRGVRIFKFDMADFDAVAASEEGHVDLYAARLRNLRAFHAALQGFRRRNPDVVLVGFNGVVGDVGSEAAPVAPFDMRWLDVFDSLYSGDPRPSNVPEWDFFRSVDMYSDHMVRSFDLAGVPLARIDSTNVMLGDTGTNYRRGLKAWRSSVVLMLAHGGWVNTIHGNLDGLDAASARWLARLQALFAPLQTEAVTKAFGSIPGGVGPYGFGSIAHDGALYTVVNPSQTIRNVRLPQLAPQQPRNQNGRVQFHDAGFAPVLDGGTVRLGPGELALVGYGRYADPADDLGIESDVRIPQRIAAVPAHFLAQRDDDATGVAPIATEIAPPASGDLRIILRQRDDHGRMMRSVSTERMGSFFRIEAWQDGKALPIAINDDKVIWTGLAWAVGEIRHAEILPRTPIRIRLSSAEADGALHLDGQVLDIEY